MKAMPLKEYNRQDALAYADRWALNRNPNYYDFSKLGGDCTNFCSQVLRAGGCSMNYNRTYGWYYRNGNDKTPSWGGVNFFHNFLTRDKDIGPVAEEVSVKDIEPGDIIQLSFVEENSYNHSLIVVDCGNPLDISNISISTHTIDRYHYLLTNYNWTKIRFLHIIGYK